MSWLALPTVRRKPNSTAEEMPRAVLADLNAMARESLIGISSTAPTIALVLGHHKANTSPVLNLFLSRVNELIARVSRQRRSA